MKKRFVMLAAVFGLTIAFMASGCSSSGGSGSGSNTGISGLTAQEPISDSPYVGTWIHEYEYFDQPYRTTLIISSGGTAAYYNEDTELGNYTASWQDNGDSITIWRSDGSVMTAYISDGTLIEQDESGAVSEYYKA